MKKQRGTQKQIQHRMRAAHIQLRTLADEGNTHAEFLWGKLLHDPKSGLVSRAGVCPHDDRQARLYWEKAAEKHHAYAVDGLGTLAMQRGDWDEAVHRWNEALSLCGLPAASFNLGVTHDPFVEGGAPQAYNDSDKALAFYLKTTRCNLARSGSRTYTADPDDVAALSLGSGNGCQSSFLPLAKKNYAGLLGRDLEKQFKDLRAEGEYVIGKEAIARLPSLYPGDISIDWKNLRAEPAMQHVSGILGSLPFRRNLGRQDDLDFRYNHMKSLLGDGTTVNSLALGQPHDSRPKPRPVAEWVDLYRQAGMKLDAPSAMKATTLVGMPDVSAWGFSLLGDYRRPVAPIPRACDYCGRNAMRRCRCGETFCDHACLRDAWPDHQDICEQVLDRAQLDCTIKAFYWRDVPVPTD
eukprot:CAMPEP_0185794400 /NCGR_PEP_ID=MMETSP1174-20130828/159995_1 /TAXON_ID=35687 /ORGANISM="Dictyocha speculum, Strain CCMP1381" /LENGTH=408 /DNA_ID=CAMNT_0028489631 /DNA_START=276 /DNA_END=1502 /DNA_ORIENTATION=+